MANRFGEKTRSGEAVSGLGRRSAGVDFTFISGGTGSTVSGKQFRTFTSSGTLEVSGAGEVGYLIVAGGGTAQPLNSTADSSRWGGVGGGGAGGARQGSLILGTFGPLPTTYPIVVGAADSPSSAFGLTATGGGQGAAYPQSPAPLNGGSGGGGGATNSGLQAAGTGIPGQGNPGGSALAPFAGGGGGGAGAVGGNASSQVGGNGGAGIPFFGSTYAGGGGGGAVNTRGTGGSGGGGNGGQGPTPPAQSGNPGSPGTANTGGGGGGGVTNNVGNAGGGTGGSGIVIVYWPYL